MKPAVLLAALAVGTMVVPSTASAQGQGRDHRGKRANDDGQGRDRTMVKSRRRPMPAAKLFPNTGAIGTKVKVMGSFDPGAKVKIGAKLIDPDRVGPKMLVFTVPPGKIGTRMVSIEGPKGTLPLGAFDVTGAASEDDDSATKAEPAPPPAIRPPEDRRHNRGRDRLRNRPIVSGFSPRAVKAGATVTIMGRNFTDQLVVKLNGQDVKAQKVGPRAIVVKVPRGTKGDATLTLMHPDSKRELVVGTLEIDKPDRAAERKKEWDERRAEAEKAWKKRRAEMAKDKKTRFERLQEREAELAQQREDRRKQALAAIRAKFKQAFLADEQTQAELALHAERKARLERIRRLSEAADEGKLVIRVQIAIEREDKRHERRMTALEAAFKASGGAQ